MDPKGRLSSQIHFLVPLGITYSDALHCGNTLENMDPKGRLSSQIHFLVPLGITYSDSILCGNTLSETEWHNS